MNLVDILKKKKKSVRLHMPGHKGRRLSKIYDDIFSLDLTELTDTDNLHDAKGIIKDMQNQAAHIYNTYQSRFLVNGTTAGILASMNSLFKPGDKVLIQRNSHISVYHAAMLSDIELIYAYDEGQCRSEAYVLNLSEIEKNKDDIKGIVITHPTFTGTCADIEKIALFAERNNIELIADEAHGAHLKFSSLYPASAEEFKCDIVVQSTHKMLSSFTQSSVLHICSQKVDTDRLDFYLRIYQSSSPSYILLNSLQQAIIHAAHNAETIFNNIISWRRELKEMLGATEYYLMEDDNYDWSKLWINVTRSGHDGYEIKNILEKKNIYIEYASFDYILALCGIGTQREDLLALGSELKAIKNSGEKQEHKILLPKAKAAMKMKEAVSQSYIYTHYKNAKNKISADFIIPYPPGIPLIAPGEIIDESIIDVMMQYEKSGMDIMGVKNGKIKIIK